MHEMENVPVDGGPESVFSDDSVALRAFAVPLALFVGWLLNSVDIGLPAVLFWHEMGHALSAWLAGRWSVPVPLIGYTFWGGESSLLIFALVAFLLFLPARWAWRERQWALFAVVALLFAVEAGMFFKDEHSREMFLIYGGCAGELFLGAAAIGSFYWKLPRRIRWDFWRFPVLLSGACSYMYAISMWNYVLVDPDTRMIGSALARSRDSDQDWVRLVQQFGWTSHDIAKSYHELSLACGAWIAAHYLFYLAAASRGPRTKAFMS